MSCRACIISKRAKVKLFFCLCFMCVSQFILYTYHLKRGGGCSFYLVISCNIEIHLSKKLNHFKVSHVFPLIYYVRGFFQQDVNHN